ncbi:thioredoxin reductase 3-like protein [Camelus ferus]|nr:thioredoxin reductase 3-like protein [Camelus ferus]
MCGGLALPLYVTVFSESLPLSSVPRVGLGRFVQESVSGSSQTRRTAPKSIFGLWARIPLLQNGSSLTPALQLGSGAPLGNGTQVSSLGGQGGGESQEVGQSLQPAEVAKHGRASVAQVILAGRMPAHVPACPPGTLPDSGHALLLLFIDNGASVQEVLSEITHQNTVPNIFVNKVHVLVLRVPAWNALSQVGVGCADASSTSRPKAHQSGLLQKLLQEDPAYDYDLIVIGGGSGGLACAQEAAILGRKVMVLDFVAPSPQGTSWVKHNWGTLTEAVQTHVGSLNWGCRLSLREKAVAYVNAHGEFVEHHKVKATNGKGQKTCYTAAKFVIATGERPRYLGIQGAKEYCITSDDLFSLPYCPGATLVVGASYVALECAGFLAGLGLEVTVMVRSVLLRGFDQEMAERLGSSLERLGVRFLRKFVPVAVLLAIGRDSCTKGIGLEKIGVKINEKNGKIPVNDMEQTNVPYVYAVGDVLEGKPQLTPVAMQAGKLLARRLFGGCLEKPRPCEILARGVIVPMCVAIPPVVRASHPTQECSPPQGCGHVTCDKAGVAQCPVNWPPSLAPVLSVHTCAHCGSSLSERLEVRDCDLFVFQCDYVNVPTVVFTPLEYGCCGLSEERAAQEYQRENLEVYHTLFWPLEWTVACRDNNACYAKIICNKFDNERVVGFHILGPNAGEITQGFAAAMKCGLTKRLLDDTVGIHPTCAEVFTTLEITKSSGLDIMQKGC